MSDIRFAGESAQNYEQKCLCVLVLDTSGSMNEIVDDSGSVKTGRTTIIDGKEYNVVNGGISRLDNLNKGLRAFYDEIASDYKSAQQMEIAIVTFDDEVRVAQSPLLIEDCPPPMLSAKGMTNLTEAMDTAIELVEARKSWYRSTNQTYYRPWIILITDGEPNDGQDIDALSRLIKSEVDQKHFQFLPIGVDNANMDVLNRLSVQLPAMPLAGTKFSQFFKWLSASMNTVIHSSEGQKVNISEGTENWISSLSNYEI